MKNAAALLVALFSALAAIITTDPETLRASGFKPGQGRK